MRREEGREGGERVGREGGEVRFHGKVRWEVNHIKGVLATAHVIVLMPGHMCMCVHVCMAAGAVKTCVHS